MKAAGHLVCRRLVIGSVLLHALTLDAQAPPPVHAWLASLASMPVPTYRVIPAFTTDDPNAITHGAVEIEVVVDASGRVAHARVVTRLADAYDRAGLEAVRRWRFRPAQRSSRPATTLLGVRFMFLPPKRAGASPEVSALTGLLPRRPLPSPAAPVVAYPLTGTPGLEAPRPVRTIGADYTEAAIRRKIQGEVEVEAVILADGTVGSARVVRSLDPTTGLDEEALISVRYWLFEPATLNGQAVPVTSRLILTFRLY
jgi:protein TonB